MDPTCATTLSTSNSRRKMMVSYASQSRDAVSEIASRTGLNLGRRAADDVEHVARRGLVFERLRQLRGPRLHLLEQPDVVDRDHRLVGEGGHKLDLLVGERPHFRARENDHAEERPFAQERDAKHGALLSNVLPIAGRLNSGSASTSGA